MQVTRDENRYTVEADMRLNVSQSAAFAAATDYERLPEFNPSIVRSERLGGRRLHSVVRLCVAFICKRIDQVMHYSEQPPDGIEMWVVSAEAGDLKSGRARWRFDADGESSARMQLDAEIEPRFWVPPVIGPYLIARELRRQARVTAESIERLAGDYEPRAQGDDVPHD